MPTSTEAEAALDLLAAALAARPERRGGSGSRPVAPDTDERRHSVMVNVGAVAPVPMALNRSVSMSKRSSSRQLQAVAAGDGARLAAVDEDGSVGGAAARAELAEAVGLLRSAVRVKPPPPRRGPLRLSAVGRAPVEPRTTGPLPGKPEQDDDERPSLGDVEAALAVMWMHVIGAALGGGEGSKASGRGAAEWEEDVEAAPLIAELAEVYHAYGVDDLETTLEELTGLVTEVLKRRSERRKVSQDGEEGTGETLLDELLSDTLRTLSMHHEWHRTTTLKQGGRGGPNRRSCTLAMDQEMLRTTTIKRPGKGPGRGAARAAVASDGDDDMAIGEEEAQELGTGEGLDSVMAAPVRRGRGARQALPRLPATSAPVSSRMPTRCLLLTSGSRTFLAPHRLPRPPPFPSLSGPGLLTRTVHPSPQSVVADQDDDMGGGEDMGADDFARGLSIIERRKAEAARVAEEARRAREEERRREREKKKARAAVADTDAVELDLDDHDVAIDLGIGWTTHGAAPAKPVHRERSNEEAEEEELARSLTLALHRTATVRARRRRSMGTGIGGVSGEYAPNALEEEDNLFEAMDALLRTITMRRQRRRSSTAEAKAAAAAAAAAAVVQQGQAALAAGKKAAKAAKGMGPADPLKGLYAGAVRADLAQVAKAAQEAADHKARGPRRSSISKLAAAIPKLKIMTDVGPTKPSAVAAGPVRTPRVATPRLRLGSVDRAMQVAPLRHVLALAVRLPRAYAHAGKRPPARTAVCSGHRRCMLAHARRHPAATICGARGGCTTAARRNACPRDIGVDAAARRAAQARRATREGGARI